MTFTSHLHVSLWPQAAVQHLQTITNTNLMYKKNQHKWQIWAYMWMWMDKQCQWLALVFLFGFIAGERGSSYFSHFLRGRTLTFARPCLACRKDATNALLFILPFSTRLLSCSLIQRMWVLMNLFHIEGHRYYYHHHHHP